MRLPLVALLAAQMALAGDLALDLMPANTKVVVGIRLSAVVQSSLFKDAGAGAQKISEEWLKLVAITGFDPLHDIDEILIASPADNEKAQALVVLRGRFDVAKMGAEATRYHGVAILGDGKSKGLLAILDATTAIGGDPQAVHSAIDRRGHAASIGPRFAARLDSLRERFDLWGTGDRPEGFVPPTGKNDGLNSMDRFEFGIRLRQGLELSAEMHTRLPADAEKLAASVQMLKAMMQTRDQSAARLDVQVKDGSVRLSMAISEQELQKAIAAQRSAMARAAAPEFAGPPVIIGAEPSSPATPAGANASDTTVVVLPGKK